MFVRCLLALLALHAVPALAGGPEEVYVFRTLEDLRTMESEGPYTVSLVLHPGRLGPYRAFDNNLAEGRDFGPIVAFGDGERIWLNERRPHPRRRARFGEVQRVGDEALYPDYRCRWVRTGPQQGFVWCSHQLRHLDLLTGRRHDFGRGRLRRELRRSGETDRLAAFNAEHIINPLVVREHWLDWKTSEESSR